MNLDNFSTKRKIGIWSGSYAIRLPKVIVELMGLEKSRN